MRIDPNMLPPGSPLTARINAALARDAADRAARAEILTAGGDPAAGPTLVSGSIRPLAGRFQAPSAKTTITGRSSPCSPANGGKRGKAEAGRLSPQQKTTAGRFRRWGAIA